MSYLTHLVCSHCRQEYSADQLIRTCRQCDHPLLACYDLAKARAELDRDEVDRRPSDLWRFREMLPVREPRYVVTLGEGGKPVLKLNQLARELGLNRLFIKDEGQNPTGSFKALGLSAAVSRVPLS